MQTIQIAIENPTAFNINNRISRAMELPFKRREKTHRLNRIKLKRAKYSIAGKDIIRFKIIPNGANINIGKIDHIAILYESNNSIFFFAAREINQRKREKRESATK